MFTIYLSTLQEKNHETKLTNYLSSFHEGNFGWVVGVVHTTKLSEIDRGQERSD